MSELLRASTGIGGLDELIHGGFPRPAVIYVGGEPGAGKTTFVVQSMFSAAKNNEKCVYITGIAEPVECVKRFMKQFSFYDASLIDNEKLIFEDLGAQIRTDLPERALGAIEPILKKHNPSRVAIDPLPPEYLFTSQQDYRRYLYALFNKLKRMDIIALVTGEKSPESTEIENYMADGVVMMTLQSIDTPFKFGTFLQIRKMRGTKHTKDMLSLDITEAGIKVIKIERIM